MRKNFIKMFFAFFFLFSCDRIKSKKVTAGAGQVKPTVFSTTCSQGFVKIQKTTSVAGSLKVGDKVTVTGRIAQGGCPGFPGAVSFTCSAYVEVDTNRIYRCESGKITGAVVAPVSAISTLQVTPPITSSPYQAVTTQPSAGRAFLGGYVMAHNNGQDVFVQIQVSPAYAQFGHSCSMSFNCGSSLAPSLAPSYPGVVR